jgi:hypothetical protein
MIVETTCAGVMVRRDAPAVGRRNNMQMGRAAQEAVPLLQNGQVILQRN